MGADAARDKRRVLDDAAAFRARGDLARAAAVLEERLRRAPDVELLTAADDLIFAGFRAGELGAVLSLARTMWAFLRFVQGDGPPIVERATTVMLFAERVGQDDLAREMAEYVLRARRGYLPGRHPDLVLALNDSARLELAAGAVDAARALYEEVAGGLPGDGPHDAEDSSRRAAAHYVLGELSARLGEGDAAERHWSNAVAWAEHLADGRPLRIAAHLRLGRLLLAFSDAPGAAHHLERASRLTGLSLQSPGEPVWLTPATDAAAVAGALFSLGVVQRGRGDILGSERALQEAIGLYSALGRRQSVAEAVAALGHTYQALGALGAAERHYEHALGILDGLPERLPQLRLRILSNLGALREQEGRLDEAGALLAEAAGLVTQETPPQQHGSLLNNRGRVAFKAHRDGEAAALYQQAVDAVRADEGERSGLADVLFNLAEARLALGDARSAVSAFREGLAIEDARLWSVLRTGSQREWLAAASRAQHRAHQLLDITVSSCAGDPAVTELAADVLLNRTGLATTADLVRREIGSWAGAAPLPEDPRLDELRRDATGLASAIGSRMLAGPPAGMEHDHAEGLIADRLRLEAIESEISARVLGRSDGEAFALSWRRIAQALPSGSALVDLRRYASYDYAADDRTNALIGEHRYAALVLRRDADPVLVPLGAAEAIDALAVDAVAAFSGLSATDAAVLSALREAVVDPLLPRLTGVRAVLIAPDGELNRLPFEAVPLGGDRLVMDEYAVSYLPTARDVLRLGAPLAPAGPPLVVADPDLDLSASADRPPQGAVPAFRRLPAARAEAEHVAGLLGVVPLLGGDAVKGRVTGARGPAVLHIATHGFFLPAVRPETADPAEIGAGDVLRPTDPERRMMTLNGVLATPIDFTAEPAGPFRRLSGEGLDDPMLRSGLALAGANTWLAGGEPPPAAGNGVVTAADLAATDLGATELVVLSACDTALGETRTGDGVFGMRRAVSLAGARSLVMSLWKVPDKQTRELMEEFYARLMAGAGVLEALTAARRAQRLKYPHPVYWAAFVCQGDSGPVRLDQLVREHR
ncbi:CHAT domain-containing protein [Kitasatospora purpeofusca]|uniref:CHAT domain-containing tetratricopeptide repeat protein n=1 Tax=Kitasatospora purpeofusca TaxID=67352 RepID=UPI002E101014|nr:CHAT domain-containing protein [Kitasatospora purpeofusca]